MSKYHLVPHPDTPHTGVRSVSVEIERRGDALLLTYGAEGSEHVALPDWVASARADNLWTTTCCELFLMPVGQEGYVEFNYAPSTLWAAYAFEGYRAGGRDLALTMPPRVDRGDEQSDILVVVEQDLGVLNRGPFAMGLSVVIEDTDGTKSYWALAHGGGPPDFHDAACFVATLPAPAAP